MFQLIQKSPSGFGTRPSGWCYEHLQHLLRSPVTAKLLYHCYSAIASGNIPELAVFQLQANCVAKSRDVWSVAIGEVLKRISAKALCYQLKAKFFNFFAPIQHGMATEGGSVL